MNASPKIHASTIIAWCIFLPAVAWPTVSFVAQALVGSGAPTDGFALSNRQLTLLIRSVSLAGTATAASLALAIAATYALVRMDGFRKHPYIVALLACLILCPPMVFAFGWDRILPVSMNANLRCIGIWALWAWPIPTLLLSLGWLTSSQGAYEAARLEMSSMQAFLRVGLRMLSPYIAISSLIVFVFFLTDYAVPHSCGIIVYATELLTWASSSSRPIDQLWLAAPLVLLTLAALCIAILSLRSTAHEGTTEVGRHQGQRGYAGQAFLLALMAATWLVPMAALAGDLKSRAAFVEAIATYDRDIGYSLLTCVLAALLAIVLGHGICAGRFLRRTAIVWIISMGALPGSLVGAALIAAYNRPGVYWVYDHWPIVVFAYVARFSWIGILVGIATNSQTNQTAADQARVDGARGFSIFRHVRLPSNGPAWIGGIGVATTLALAEISTTSMVRVPAFSPISLVLVEKFHRFEHQMLISLSLCLVLATIPAAGLLVGVLRRH